MYVSTVFCRRLDGAMWPPMEPISALITLKVNFMEVTPHWLLQVGFHCVVHRWSFTCISLKRSNSMPAKQFQFHADARQSILRGASVLADAVRVTLGPKS